MIKELSSKSNLAVCFKPLSKSDVTKYELFVKNGWFQRLKIFNNKRNKVYGLFIINNEEIQGVIAVQEHAQNQIIHVELMEAAPHNRTTHEHPKYAGVGKNLLCFAINFSVDAGFEGFIGLSPKKNTNEKYYQTLGAKQARSGVPPYYYFDTSRSSHLLNKYMPGGVQLC